MTSPKIADLPRFSPPSYRPVIGALHALDTIEKWQDDYDLDLTPDFQRARVWTPAQQTAWLEHAITVGISGTTIFFNHPGWMTSFEGDFVLVDGLQRLTALRAFLEDQVPVFGHRFSDYDDPRRLNTRLELTFAVNTLQTRSEVLAWYLGMNNGGTAHSDEEIQRVRDLLCLENSGSLA